MCFRVVFTASITGTSTSDIYTPVNLWVCLNALSTVMLGIKRYKSRTCMFFGILVTSILQVLKRWANEKRTSTFYILINECFYARLLRYLLLILCLQCGQYEITWLILARRMRAVGRQQFWTGHIQSSSRVALGTVCNWPVSLIPHWLAF